MILAVGLVAVGLASCGEETVRISEREPSIEEGSPLRAISALNCPAHQGALTRIETASDGLSCLYAGSRGSRVTLQLVTVEADQPVPDVLAPFDQSIRALLPETAARAAGAGGGEPPVVSVQSNGENARVRLPGIRIDQDDEQTSISIAGIRFHANNGPDPSESEIVSVSTNGTATEVRTLAPGPDIRATYILSDEAESAEGWRTVGYEARGPAAGPVVVALVKSKDHEEDGLFDAARELVTLNVGGAP